MYHDYHTLTLDKYGVDNNWVMLVKVVPESY